MKRHFSLFVVGLVTACSPLLVNGQVSLSIGNNAMSVGINIGSPQDFYQPLSSMGAWVNVPQYGRCWHPNDVSADWQPYVNGQWVWTDAGWYWQSDEPWSWAVYHYGSWVNEPSYGWCWIPGTEWAPAWVTWRDSDDYVGWAPCGPDRRVLGPQFFVFTGVHDFNRHFRGRGDFVRNDEAIIGRTRVLNDFSTRNVNIDGREKRISYNRGPDVQSIQRATGSRFEARPVQDIIKERHQPTNTRQKNRNNEQRPATEQQRNRNEQQNIPPSSQERNRNQQQQQQREIQPTGREHGVTTPQQEQQRQTPRTEQPTQPNRNEQFNRNEQPNRNGQNVTPSERPVPPTGQEHGISTPPQQREVPTPSQPNRTERPTPQPQQRENQVPPTGKEHGISTPPQQREVPAPSQPNNRTTERPTPTPMAPRQASPTGQEHGTSYPQQQRETARPAESQPKAQPAPRQEKPAQEQQPQQRKQDGNQ